MPIPEVDKIWMNGELKDWNEAKIHILTHSLHYGSGVFEGIRAYKTSNGAAVFRLREHMVRLFKSAKIYYIDIPYTVDELCKATCDVIKANGLDSCYIRPLVIRGYGEMGLNPLAAPVDVSIAVWPWGAYLGEEGIKSGVRVKISSFRRNDANAIPPAAKACGQYLNSILAKVEVVKAGYDEAIILNERGHVSDGSGENVFIVRKGNLITPPTSSGALEGITRDSIMAIAEDEGIPFFEHDIVRSDLYFADEAFFTGTAAEIVPIREVDEREIGTPGPITRKLQERYYSIVQGEDKSQEQWLTFVE